MRTGYRRVSVHVLVTSLSIASLRCTIDVDSRTAAQMTCPDIDWSDACTRSNYESECLQEGVRFYRCYDGTYACDGPTIYREYVVLIDRNRANSELWVMEKPVSLDLLAHPPTPRGMHNGAWHYDLEMPLLEDLAAEYGAIAAIDGFTYDCKGGGYACLSTPNSMGFPTTRTYESELELATTKTTWSWTHEYLMGTGPTSRGGLDSISMQMVPLNATHGVDTYNLFSSTLPAVEPTAQGTRYSVPSGEVKWYTAIGYSPTHIVMLLSTGVTLARVQPIFARLGVTDAVYMDGGSSARMYVDAGEEACSFTDGTTRYTTYGIGLVELGIDQVTNGTFFRPDISQDRGPDANGRQEYNWSDEGDSGWSGATIYYRDPTSGDQQAAIVPRSDDTYGPNHLQQTLSAPHATYCRLHFRHGFQAPQGCASPQSALRVSVTTHGGMKDVCYQSSNQQGLDEQWLRFRTPERGPTVLTFTAPTATQTCGAPSFKPPCQARIRDVSVRCVAPPR